MVIVPDVNMCILLNFKSVESTLVVFLSFVIVLDDDDEDEDEDDDDDDVRDWFVVVLM